MAEYKPTDDRMREQYRWAHAREAEGAAEQSYALQVCGEVWDAWLAAHDARIRRDAAREALDGLVQKFQWGGWSDTLKRGSQSVDLMGNANRVTGWMRVYRDTHYPETED